MQQKIKDIREASDEIAQDLTGYATRAAIAQLITNWTDAVNDANPQFTARSAVADIDQVIENLTKLKLRLSNDPLANRQMRVGLGLAVEFPAWESLSEDERDSWISSYRERHDYAATDEDVTTEAKDDYQEHKGIEPTHPLANTR